VEHIKKIDLYGETRNLKEWEVSDDVLSVGSDECYATYVNASAGVGYEFSIACPNISDFRTKLKKCISEFHRFFGLNERREYNLTAFGRETLILLIDEEIKRYAPKRDASLEKLQADKKLYFEKIKIFQTEVNSAFGFPADNPWQDTLAGIQLLSSAVSGNSELKKVSGEDATVLSYTNAPLNTCTASYIGEKVDGTRIMVVVSGSPTVDIDIGKVAAETCRSLAQHADSRSLEEQRKRTQKVAANHAESIDSYSYLYLSHLPGGEFGIIGEVKGNTTIIAFDPITYTFSTIAKASLASQTTFIKDSLPEGTLLLCLTSETLKHLPTIGLGEGANKTQEINFEKLKEEGFTFPAEVMGKINESTLITALANHAANNHRKTQDPRNKSNAEQNNAHPYSTPPQQFFIAGLNLSNDLKANPWFNPLSNEHKTNPWLNPANFAVPLLVVMLGVAFSFKLWAAPVFINAAPVFLSLVLGAFTLASAMLLLYLGDTVIKDWRNQSQSRKVEVPYHQRWEELQKQFPESNRVPQPETQLDFFITYGTGILPRINEWLLREHHYQAAFGTLITLVMFTLASLVLASVLNPIGFDATVVGHALSMFFHFLAHTLSQLSQGIPFLQFEADSIASHIIVMAVVALVPTFCLNALRQIATAIYERFKDESLSNVEAIRENAPPKDAKVNEPKEDQSVSHNSDDPSHKQANQPNVIPYTAVFSNKFRKATPRPRSLNDLEAVVTKTTCNYNYSATPSEKPSGTWKFHRMLKIFSFDEKTNTYRAKAMMANGTLDETEVFVKADQLDTDARVVWVQGSWDVSQYAAYFTKDNKYLEISKINYSRNTLDLDHEFSPHHYVAKRHIHTVSSPFDPPANTLGNKSDKISIENAT
jgi:hypothetical protein